jgi:hypothetical protein
MATVVTTAMLSLMIMVEVESCVHFNWGTQPMRDLKERSRSGPRAEQAASALGKILDAAGWNVNRQPEGFPSGARPDMIIDRDGLSYVVEVKLASEGRSDRLIPLWSQALLQAAHIALPGSVPLAVVAAPSISPHVANQVLDFAAKHSPEAAAGVIDFEGLRRFRGRGLENLNADHASQHAISRAMPGESLDLFSDLNQWMLKVLLAPELPEKLLSAPRDRYPHASALAQAANVSVMSASRFVRHLKRDGYLDPSVPYLRLVRRESLFQRWESSTAVRRVKELPVRFLLPAASLERLLHQGSACLGLFAAAERLGFGFVHGVPQHVYVKRLNVASLAKWKNVVPAEPHEVPNLIIRQAVVPNSVFRGVVSAGGVPVSDVLQVWLDVSAHPARGQEQADMIRDRVIGQLIHDKRARG